MWKQMLLLMATLLIARCFADEPSTVLVTPSTATPTTPPPTVAPPPNITLLVGPSVIIDAKTLATQLATVAGTTLVSRVVLDITTVGDSTLCTFFFRETQFSANGPLSSLWLSFYLQNAVRDRTALYISTFGYLDAAATWNFGILPATQPPTPVPPSTRNPKLPPLPFVPAPFGGKVIDQNITVGGSGSGSSSGTTVGVVVGVIVGCIVLGAGVGFIKWYTNRQQNSKGGSKYVPGQV